MKKWQEKVYRSAKIQRLNFLGAYWRKIRLRIILRDEKQCQRCENMFDDISLTVHHIVPRKLGGNNKMKNLITLCHPCHDYIETNGIDKLKGKVVDRAPSDSQDWRKWVYGGYQSPNK